MSSIPVPTTFPVKYYSYYHHNWLHIDAPSGPLADGTFWFRYTHIMPTWEAGFWMPTKNIPVHMWDEFVATKQLAVNKEHY